MEKDLEYMRISRSNANKYAPKGGAKIVKDERARREELEQYQSANNLRFDPSSALLNAIQSKSIQQLDSKPALDGFNSPSGNSSIKQLAVF